MLTKYEMCVSSCCCCASYTGTLLGALFRGGFTLPASDIGAAGLVAVQPRAALQRRADPLIGGL